MTYSSLETNLILKTTILQWQGLILADHFYWYTDIMPNDIAPNDITPNDIRPSDNTPNDT